MLIFGHHLYFQDEPALREEYGTFVGNNLSKYNTVRVVEIFTNPDFSFTTDWSFLSGQEARYFTSVPVREKSKQFDWALEIKDIVTLVWDSEAKTIFYKKGQNYTIEQFQFWIFHTFFPMVLELEHIYRILHVGSVAVEGKPILFSAFSYGGKSTLTDYFIQKGHPLLSDDSLGIEKRGSIYYAIPSYPFHRPYREFETLGYYTENFLTDIKPLHAVYTLEKAEPDAAVNIVELKGIEKFKAFHYSSFIDFDFMKKERFAFFTEMVKYVPVYKVTIPWELKRLEEVYRKIIEHTK